MYISVSYTHLPYDLKRTKFIIDKDIEIIYDTNRYRYDDPYDL